MAELESLIKEVYTRFGLSYYLAEVLHRGLCNAYVFLSFEKAEQVTKPRIEEKFAFAFSLTLGQVIREVEDFLPSQLAIKLHVALDRRNFLAHHFWFERVHLMYNPQGLDQMLQELEEMSDLFNQLDEQINEYIKTRRSEFGVTNDVISTIMNDLISGNLEEPLMSQRRLKKQERLVNIWDVEVTSNLVTQIFEMEDGTFWQLCDVGLGWSRFITVEDDWRQNEKVQEYLPARINPRPAISQPWEYEFRLKKRMVLWVKPGKREKSYTWGLKKS